MKMLKIALASFSALFVLLGSILLGVGMQAPMNATTEVTVGGKTEKTSQDLGVLADAISGEPEISSLLDPDLKTNIENAEKELNTDQFGVSVKSTTNMKSRYDTAIAGFAFFMLAIPAVTGTVYVFIKKRR